MKDIAGISGKSHVAVIHKVKIHDLFKKLAGNDSKQQYAFKDIFNESLCRRNVSLTGTVS